MQLYTPTTESCTYRLQVAMDDPLVLQELQTLQQCAGKSPYESDAEALEVVLLDQFIEIDPARQEGRGRW